MAQSTIQTVALFGASGNLGKPLLAALLDDGYTVTVIARTSSKATYPEKVVVKNVSDAFSKDEVKAAISGQDAVIVAFAHAGNGHHRTIMDAAAEAGVKHFIPNYWSTNAELQIARDASERQRSMDEDIDYLRTMENKLPWTAIVTGIWFDLAFSRGLLGFNLRDESVEIWDEGDATFSASTMIDVVKATIAVLKHSEAVQNQFVYVAGFSTSQNELMRVVESISGQKWNVKHVKGADKVREARATIEGGAKGIPWLIAQGTLAVSALYGGEKYQSDFERYGRSSNAIVGLKTGSVTEAVRAHMG